MTKSSVKVRQNFCRTKPNLPKSAEPRTEPKFRSFPISFSMNLVTNLVLDYDFFGLKLQVITDQVDTFHCFLSSAMF